MQVIEKRAFNLLQYIVSNDYCTVDRTMKNLKCTERQILYDLSKINGLLKEKDINPIRLTKGRFQITGTGKSAIRELDFSDKRLVVSGEDKIWLSSIMIFCAGEPLGVNHFISSFQAGRNTVLNDLKKLSSIVQKYDVELVYTRKKGYHFTGAAKNIRTVVLLAISNIKNNYLSLELITLASGDKGFPQRYGETKRKIKGFIKEYSLPVIREYLAQSLYFIALLPYHCNSIAYEPVAFLNHLWIHLPFYSAVECLYKTLDDDITKGELDYLFILLMSMTLGNDTYFQVYKKESEFLRCLSGELVKRFEAVTGTVFQDKDAVAKNLRMHLQPAFFRLKYGIPVVNPALAQIKKDYGEIFSICRLIMEPFSDYVDCMIPEDEIAYITIHFMAMMEEPEPEKMRKRAVIVCQNGVAGSVMMKNQLRRMFPEIVFLEPCNAEEFLRIPGEGYDVIFTTSEEIEFGPDKIRFVISPIMTADEKLAVMEEVYSSVFGLKTESRGAVNSLLEMISEYATIHDEEKLAAAIHAHLNKRHQSERKDGLPVLKDLINEETIMFAEEAADWEEAILMGAKPLLDNGSIDIDYVDAMIYNIKKHGPYIIVCPNVAIPHANNKKGVHKLGMSFLKLEKKVEVLGNPEKAVQVLITLAAKDDKTHLKALAQLSNLLSDPKLRERLLSCETSQEVLETVEMVS